MDSGFVFGKRSLKNLEGVHPRLVVVMSRALALSEVDFTITEGARTFARQKQLVEQGNSWTMNSKHLPQRDGYSHAVDVAALVGGKVSWDWGWYEKINAAVQNAAAELGEKITWGGGWKTFKDGPHFQIENILR